MDSERVNEPLLASAIEPDSISEPHDVEPAPQASITPGLRAQLYTSHFLSTWNCRLFEFAAVLFLASTFPGTLLPLSAYALCRAASAIVLAHPIGAWIDQGDRLTVVRASIVGQRCAVAASCVVFGVMQIKADDSWMTYGLFAMLVLLACVEKVCAVMNLISIERDWVVVITEGDDKLRQAVNAQMRRIDLVCKLCAPLAISFLDMASTRLAIVTVFGINLFSVMAEYICIARVYSAIPALQRTTLPTAAEASTASDRRQCCSPRQILPISMVVRYFKHPAFLPSFSLSLLYLTVLSFNGQLITFLVSVEYTSLHVGVLRTLSTAIEVSATWAAPRVVDKIGAIRGGLWSLSWLVIWLTTGVVLFLQDTFSESPQPQLIATILAICVAASRLGLWGYDLCAQLLIQEEVEADQRGNFSTAESAFQNLFELLAFATTIIFPRPEDFHWPTLFSLVAVYSAVGFYAPFARSRRGHLLHMPVCLERKPAFADGERLQSM